MQKILILCIIGGALLIQNGSAYPAPDSEQKDTKVDDCDDDCKAAKEFENLAHWTFHETEKVFNAALVGKDLIANGNLMHLSECVDLIHMVTGPHELIETFEVFDQVIRLLIRYCPEDNKVIEDRNRGVSNMLKEHGLDNLCDQTIKRFTQNFASSTKGIDQLLRASMELKKPRKTSGPTVLELARYGL